MVDVFQRLPNDLVIEILVHLPVKSILQYKCVSKKWYGLIRSSLFINRHKDHGTKQSILLVKSHLLPENDVEYLLSFHDLESPQVLVSPNLSIPIPNDPHYPDNDHSFINLLGPCNGLVCLIISREIIFICNPALREFRHLPSLRMGYESLPIAHGFGFDPSACAYKIVQFRKVWHDNEYDYPGNQRLRIDVYSSISNSWKEIDSQVLPTIWWSSCGEVFFNNTIYWSVFVIGDGGRDQYILCFNTSLEDFRLIDFPRIGDDDRNRCFHNLMVLNERLAMSFCDPTQGAPVLIDIWVMKEYGANESWTKLFSIGPYSLVCPFLRVRNELLLLAPNTGQLITCPIDEDQHREFSWYCDERSLGAMVYKESLVSLDMAISG